MLPCTTLQLLPFKEHVLDAQPKDPQGHEHHQNEAADLGGRICIDTVMLSYIGK